MDLNTNIRLFNCLLERDTDAIKQILNSGECDVNKILPDKEMNVLHLATGIEPENYGEIITELILINGGNPNECTVDGLTTLHIACIWGRINVLHLLLDYGADPFMKDYHNKLPLDYATENGHFDVVNALLDYFKNYYDYCNNSPAYSLKLEKVIVESKSIKGEYEFVQSEESDSKISSLIRDDVNISDLTSNKILYISHKSDNGLSESSINDFDNNIFTINSSQSSEINLEQDNVVNFNSKSSSLYHTCDEFVSLPDSTEDSTGCNKFSESESLFSKVSPLKFTRNQDNDLFSVFYDSNDCQSSKESLIFENEISSCSPFPHRNYRSKTTLNRDKTTLTDAKIKSNDIIDTEKNVEPLKTFPICLNVSDNVSVHNITSQLPDSNDTKSIIEEFKYEDKKAGVVLVEKRILSTASITHNQTFEKPQLSRTSSVASLPLSVDYDTDGLRKELVIFGVNPGPITISTKKLYLKKLQKLKKENFVTTSIPDKIKNRVYSVELQKSLRDFTWTENLSLYLDLEKKIIKQFEVPDPKKRWREGIIKSSFTYLLLDPRVTNDLPNKIDKVDMKDLWRSFLDSIFYVGKGKRSRPYSHLYQAVSFHNTGQSSSQDKKIQHILDIWRDSLGVVCLHIFQNVIPAEAYTREAAMIDVLGLKNLKNVKSGNYYGIAATWSLKEKKLLGLYLLYRAMLIFLNEGERQLRPVDIC